MRLKTCGLSKSAEVSHRRAFAICPRNMHRRRQAHLRITERFKHAQDTVQTQIDFLRMERGERCEGLLDALTSGGFRHLGA